MENAKPKKRIVIYDFETNGVNHLECQPIEFACIVVEANGTIKPFSTLIHCKQKLPPVITQITGITDKDLVNAMSLPEVFRIIADIFDTANKMEHETLIVGHNILHFDNQFANKFLKLYGYKEVKEENCFDTAMELKGELMEKSRGAMPDHVYHRLVLNGPKIKGFSLTAACTRYNVLMDKPAHRALTDVEYTFEVFKKQIEIKRKRAKTVLPNGKALDSLPAKTNLKSTRSGLKQTLEYLKKNRKYLSALDGMSEAILEFQIKSQEEAIQALNDLEYTGGLNFVKQNGQAVQETLFDHSAL